MTSLRVRLALWSFVGALALAGALTALFARGADAARNAQLRAEGRRVALAATTLYDVLRMNGSDADRATLQAFLSAAVNGAGERERLAWALVLDADGAVVAGDLSPPLIDVAGVDSLEELAPLQAERLPAHLVAIDANVVGREHAERTRSAGEQGAPDAPMARVLVGLSTRTSASSAALMQTVLVSALVSTLAALAAALLFYVVVTRRVVRPLARVVAGMDAVKSGKRDTLEGLPARGDEAAALVEGFNDMVGALVEGERSKSALERHVGKKLAGELSSTPPGTVGLESGRRVRVTALFFDVEGFATVMGRESPETVVSLLQEVIGGAGGDGGVVEIVQRHDGHVEKIMGDTVLALWGLPSPKSDDAERAVRAAIDIVDRCHAISEGRRARREEPFSVGVGVASGDAVVARVGTKERVENVVVGECIVLAKKIEREARAQGFGVLVAEDTFGAVRNRFEGAPTPPILVEGIGVPLTLYRVRPRKDAPSWAEPTPT